MSEVDGELDLRDYLALLRRRWRWVAATLILVVGVVTVATLLRDETYEAESRLQVLTPRNQGLFNTTDERLFRVVSAEIGFMTSETFARLVETSAGREVDFEVSPRVAAPGEEIEDASMIDIVARGATAREASTGADIVAQTYLTERLRIALADAQGGLAAIEAGRDALIAQRQERFEALAAADAAVRSAPDPLSLQIAQLEFDALSRETEPIVNDLSERIGILNVARTTAQGRVNILERDNSTARIVFTAEVPSAPVSPDVPRNIMISVVIGLVLGLILAILRDLLDSKARDGAGLARLVDIPVMATIGEIRSQRGAPGRVGRYRDLSVEESSGYQVLLNSLWLTNVDDPLQSIVFTSDRPSVGKTQTVVNLAQAEAARGTRVLVIDSDFVNPGVAARLDLEPSELGLADLLEGGVAIEHVVRATDVENLHIIDAHGSTSAGELLRSDRFESVLVDLYAHYDLILIDSPPTLSTADSRLVASQADAVVVVYDPALSRREELQRTIDLLRGARANLIGLVANRSRASHPVYLSVRAR